MAFTYYYLLPGRVRLFHVLSLYFFVYFVFQINMSARAHWTSYGTNNRVPYKCYYQYWKYVTSLINYVFVLIEG